MAIDFEKVRQTLLDHYVFDAWQFIENTFRTISFAEHSKDVIIGLLSQMSKEHDEWQAMLSKKLSKDKQVAVKADDFPKNEVSVAGVTANASFLLNKYLKDFFQYSRNVFDSISQAANSGLLANKRKATDTVDFLKMKSTFQQQSYASVFPDMSMWYQRVAAEDSFLYIDAFCNRTKHTLDVLLQISHDIFDDTETSAIKPFFHKLSQQNKQDISSYIQSIFDFVVSEMDKFIDILIVECLKNAYNDNRYHKVKVHQIKLGKSTDNPDIELSNVYIEDTRDISNLPTEIYILFVHQYDDKSIEARNSPLDRVLVSDNPRSYRYRYNVETQIGDDTMLIYRKYLLDTSVTDHQLVFDESRKAQVFYHANPYMDITSESDDPQFLARTQLPF